MNRIFFGLDKKGGYKVWDISVIDQIEYAVISINHGQEGGKMQQQVTVVEKGKQGRTVVEQAISEAEGKIKKQIDRGYRENKADLEELPILPMLAGDYNKIGHRIDWTKPVYGSDKLDGVRCMAKKKDGVVTLESRTGQPYDLPHIVKELSFTMRDNEVFDGEIYLHGYALQEITSAVKRTDTQAEVDKAKKAYNKEPNQATLQELGEATIIDQLRPELKFVIFDVLVQDALDMTFVERLDDLRVVGNQIALYDKQFLEVIPYTVLRDESMMKLRHADCVARGYEGIMLRNACGIYESGKRSADLQKYKTFLDSEFEIIDVVADKEGCAVFVCKNDLEDNTFEVIMGSKEQKQKWVLTPEQFIGKMITVKYQSRYKGTLKPQFPVGLAIRDYE